jgi:plasmid stabilization system protein ParE
MRPVLLWTPQACEDLLDIYVTIGLDNPSAAERIYTAMLADVCRGRIAENTSNPSWGS